MKHFLTPAAFTWAPLTDQGILHLGAKFLGGNSAPLRTSTNRPLLEKHLHKETT